MSELNYVVLNPVHSTFQSCPMVIDPNKCDYTFEIDIHKHFSILTDKKFYKKINIFNRSEYPE
jgi:hypothetical protein